MLSYYPYRFVQKVEEVPSGLFLKYKLLYKGNPHASFGFIGANMQNESIVNTKRFRVYRRLMATYFNESNISLI